MADKRKRMGAREWLAFFSWIVLTILIVTIDHGFRSSGFSKGFLDSLEPAIKVIPLIAGAASVIWLILISRIFKRKKKPLIQWLLILLPVIIFAAWTFRKVPSPRNQFLQITGIELPSEIQDLKSSHHAVLFSREVHTFSFRCSPSETTRLINEVDWRGPRSWAQNGSWIHKQALHSIHNINIDTWSEPEVYSNGPKKGGWTFTLVTDKNRERVFIKLSDN